MPPSSNSTQTWLIEQYLLGNLPPGANERIEQQMRIDPAFGQRVMAQWLVLEYIGEEQQATQLYQSLKPATRAAGGQKPLYVSHKRITFLWQLLGIGMAATLLLCLGLWQFTRNQQPVERVGTVPLVTDGTEQYGMGDAEDSVVVLRYDRSPGWWRFSNRYTWAGDTLRLYSRALSQQPTGGWTITPTDQRNVYRLKTDRQVYQLLRGRTELLDLQPDETR